MNKEIQIAGHTCFEEARWREAILYFLFGIWAGKLEVMHRPKIRFGDVTLRLDEGAGEYLAYGIGDDFAEKLHELQPILPTGGLSVDNGNQADVEMGLIRFVKNDQVRVLILQINGGILCLSKKERRGEYDVSVARIPLSFEGTRGFWATKHP